MITMKNNMKIFIIIIILVMALTGATPTITAEAKTTNTTIIVVNKATGKKIKVLNLMFGKHLQIKHEQVQLKVEYGKKDVTKKAKYKTSNKCATVSKKGKITAKTSGTCIVTVKYKKKTKKISVTVYEYKTKEEKRKDEKDNMRTEVTIDDLLYGPTLETPYIKASEEDCIRYRQMVIESNQIDPNPSCTHEWEANSYDSDIGDIYDNFGVLYKTHLFLHGIRCKKCDKYATTNPVPYLEAINYTSDDFAKNIICYGFGLFASGIMKNETTGVKHGIKHKHKGIYSYSPYTNLNGSQGWMCSGHCAYCTQEFEEFN